MEMSGFVIFVRQHWGNWLFTFDVVSGRNPTLAEASLNMTLDEGHHAVGVRSFKTRNTPVSDERTVDFGDLYWTWPGTVFDQTMTEVTFAVRTGASQLTGHFKVTFFEF